MRLKVLFHDSCFDGSASAAVFTRFFRERVNASAEVDYEGLSHQAGGRAVDEALFTGDENAIVDFRYSQSPRLTWWFDHHQSAFQLPGDLEHFQRDNSGKKFHDPKRKSCTAFLAEVLAERFGFDRKPLAELLYWAEIVDGALFTSPAQAVELEEPALKLMTVLEANKDPLFGKKVIGWLERRPLGDIVKEGEVRERLLPLLQKHRQAIELIRKKCRVEAGVCTFDVADEGLEGVNKFIAYYLYPEARYTVWVGRGPGRSRISLGSNPWRPQERKHDLAKLAEKYGGGGHPVVAGVSFPASEIESARKAAREIVDTLKGA